MLSRPADAIRLSEVLNALDNGILERTGPVQAGDGSLRGAVNACLWEKMNSALIGFAESKTLADFTQECRNQMTGDWDLYII